MANKQKAETAATEAAKFIMSDEDIRKAYILVADQLTPDATANMYCEVLADITQRDPDIDKATRYDKLLFAARECFLNGLVKGFSLYREAIKMEAGEPV